MNTRPTVMFVDDEPHIVNLLRVMFHREYDVVTAGSGTEALALFRSLKRPVHVIVSDQRMPGINGSELLSEVSRLSPGTMRILLTGYSDMSAMVGSINDGEVFRFIAKPWNPDAIRRTLAEACDIARATGDVATKAGAQQAAPATSAPGGIDVDALPDRAPLPVDEHGLSIEEEMPGLLLIGETENTVRWFGEHFGLDFPFFIAPTLADALVVIEHQLVGVVVTDTQVGGSSSLGFLRLLKQNHPSIMTVVLTGQTDAEHVIQMINEVQVCRLAFRPLRRGAIDLCVRAAMNQHLRTRDNPVLTRRQAVVHNEARDEAAATQLTDGLAARLRRLGERFGLGLRGAMARR